MTRSRKQQIANTGNDVDSASSEQTVMAAEEQYEFNDNEMEEDEKPRKLPTRARSSRKATAIKRTHPDSDDDVDDDEYQQQEEDDDDDENYEEPKRKSTRVTRASNRKRK